MQVSGSARTDRNNFLRLAIPLMIAEAVAAFEVTMIFAAMPTLSEEFGGPSSAAWLITSFMLSSAAGTALFGRLGDFAGRRKILLWTVALATIGSLISSLTDELGWLIVGRSLQGTGGAIIPLCFGILREHLSADRVPMGISLVSASATIAAAAGLLGGGLIIDHFHWSMIFKVTTAFGLFAFITVMAFVPRDTQFGTKRPDDLLGGLMFLIAVSGLLLAIDFGARYGFADPVALGCMAGSLALLLIWVRHELRVNNPLIDLRLFTVREIRYASVISIVMALGAFQGGQIISLYGQQPLSTGTGLGLSATLAALLLLPGNILAAFSYPWMAKAAQKWGPQAVIRAGFLLILIGFGTLIVFKSSAGLVLLLLTLQAIGLGAIYVVLPMVVVAASPMERTSEAAGMFGVIRTTAMAFGAQVIGIILSSKTTNLNGSSYPGALSYDLIFTLVAATAIIGIFLAKLMPKTLS